MGRRASIKPRAGWIGNHPARRYGVRRYAPVTAVTCSRRGLRSGYVVRGGAFHAEAEPTHAGTRTLAAADQITGSFGVRFVRPLRR